MSDSETRTCKNPIARVTPAAASTATVARWDIGATTRTAPVTPAPATPACVLGKPCRAELGGAHGGRDDPIRANFPDPRGTQQGAWFGQVPEH